MKKRRMNQRGVEVVCHYPEYYRRFSCIGGQCEATCCAGWRISVDASSMKAYKRVRGDFGKRLRSAVNVREQRFKTEKGHCPMLSPEGLCDIYRALGPDKMCRTCRIYPRHMEDYGALREYMLSLSCPEAARLILGNEKPFAYQSRRRQLPISAKEADAGIALKDLRKIMKLRARIFQVLARQQEPFWSRIGQMLCLAEGAAAKAETAQQNMAAPGSETAGAAGTPPGRCGEHCAPLAAQWLEVLWALEPVSQGWRPFLKESFAILRSGKNCPGRRAAFEQECQEHIHYYENLAAHYVYMYFAGAVYDGPAAVKARLAAFHVRVLHELHYARWLAGTRGLAALVEAVWIYSRQVDHSDTNLEALENLLLKFGQNIV